MSIIVKAGEIALTVALVLGVVQLMGVVFGAQPVTVDNGLVTALVTINQLLSVLFSVFPIFIGSLVLVIALVFALNSSIVLLHVATWLIKRIYH